MKKRLSRTGFLFAVCVLTMTGCASASGSGDTAVQPENLTGQELTDAKTMAAEYMAGFVAGVRSEDFSRFEEAIPSEAKGKVTAEMFRAMCRDLKTNLGELTASEYLGELDQTLVRDYLWKLTFEKKSSTPGKEGELLRKQVVYMVRVGKLDGVFHIAGSGFRF